jgi:hypothetical protein
MACIGEIKYEKKRRRNAGGFSIALLISNQKSFLFETNEE